MTRIRDLGIFDSDLPTGLRNTMTDVAGVSVGHSTVIEGEGAWSGPGNGPFRTGVTVILPHQGNIYEDKVAAAVYRINGFGKYAGFEQVRENGNIETPIGLTSTLNMPSVANALISVAIEQSPHIGVGFEATGYQGYASVNPLVAECSDGFLNDAQGRRIGEKEVREAISSATMGGVPEGGVGGGTGMSCFGWKGGIGTASRVIPESEGGFTIGVLVESNFGAAPDLTISGVPVGKMLLPPGYKKAKDVGSIVMVIATDAPVDARQLERLCKRASFGLARTGSKCEAGSGDVVIAFSTTYRVPDRSDSPVRMRETLGRENTQITIMGKAVVEAVEEAIYNSLFVAETMVGRDGNTRHGLPAEEVAGLVARHRPVAS